MNCTNIPKILRDFTDYLSIKNYSKETISLYTYDLMTFFKFIKFYKKINMPIKDFSYVILNRVKSDDIISYLYFLNDTQNNISSTRYRKQCEIKLFFNWLFPTLENPVEDLMKVNKIKHVPKYLSLNESKKIQSIFTENNSNFPLRNNTIITLLLSSAIRVSELKNINIEDIDFKNKTIEISKGKGNKSRIAYFNEHCKKQLLIYIKSKQEKILDLKAPLFTTSRNTRCSRRTIEVICENAFKLMGVEEKHYTTHTLRHTAATITYNYVKQDILLIKEILGHSSVESTKIYTHIENKNIKNAVESNPLANFDPNNKEEEKYEN